VTPGYWNDPDATAATIDEHGWLRTGDVGYLTDDGYLCIVDRIKDVVISGGFNVFPSEVEHALRDLPGLEDVAVYGVPDEKWGERICVAVVGEDVDLITIQARVRERLAGYKVPRELRRYDVLPVNATGKVLRRALRDTHDG
jgi:acyl-CoA synthetase (AMP-forming)/AMP-acid ligase II